MNSIVVEYINTLCSQCFPEIDNYEECKEYATKRKDLEDILKKYDSHSLKITQLA
jgi:hypothetical protein